MSGRFAPYGWALLLHAVLVALLGVSLHAPTPRTQPVAQAQQEPEPIQARAVDEAQVQAEVQRLRDETRRQQQQEEARLQKLKDEERQARETRQREEQRAAEVKRRAAEEQKQRAAAEQERKVKEAAEQKRLAELKQAQAEAEKKRVAELEAKRKQDEERLRREGEARKKAAAEAELKAKMAEAQRQMEAEAQKRAQERARQNATLTQRYIADIRNKVERNWLRPASVRAGMTCTVLVQQLPTGDVVGVRVTRSSGDAVFDRSVENAVHKASPLPPPPVPEVWEREIEFIFEAR